MQKEGITPQIKKLEQIKLSPSRESRTADKFTTKKKTTQEPVSNIEITLTKQKQLDKSKVAGSTTNILGNFLNVLLQN